ncbi:phage integrase SAM-like domain-containing protein [Natronorubrum sp. FCH18a]|uniref:phage integrase SAM-like domain-containing protein n=1 Tax=Natronorubrum sp. FCH18a TaxID=3447018 RepID=UPI003F514085
MDSSERKVPDRSSGGRNAVRAVKERYKKTLSGRSKVTVDHVLEEWIDHFGLESFDKINRDLCRRYGEYLADQTDSDDRELSASTVHTYYDYIRARSCRSQSVTVISTRIRRIGTTPTSSSRRSHPSPTGSSGRRKNGR